MIESIFQRTYEFKFNIYSNSHQRYYREKGKPKYFFGSGPGRGEEFVNGLEGKLMAMLRLSVSLTLTATLHTDNGEKFQEGFLLGGRTIFQLRRLRVGARNDMARVGFLFGSRAISQLGRLRVGARNDMVRGGISIWRQIYISASLRQALADNPFNRTQSELPERDKRL